MPDETVSVIFDCNVFVQAFLNPASAAARCFELVRSGRAQLFVSPPTLEELREVLSRPHILAFLPQATPGQAESFLEEVLTYATTRRSVPEKFRFERDPKDAPYLNLAIAAVAFYLVTRDRDLLDLMTAHDAESKDFRQRFRQIKVIEPEEFLRSVEEAT